MLKESIEINLVFRKYIFSFMSIYIYGHLLLMSAARI